MSILHTHDLEGLQEFTTTQDQLALVERDPLKGAEEFFSKLMETPFSVIGQAFKESSLEDIKYILEDDIPTELQKDTFYARWVADIANLCETFCNILGNKSVGFQLGTKRGCRRYHVDNVPMRLLVTYAGKGTEWIHDDVADRQAFENGKPNESILKDPCAVQFISVWDVAIFRGGNKGLLHRTPNSALNGQSILLRLDHENYWEDTLTQSTTVYI